MYSLDGNINEILSNEAKWAIKVTATGISNFKQDNLEMIWGQLQNQLFAKYPNEFYIIVPALLEGKVLFFDSEQESKDFINEFKVDTNYSRLVSLELLDPTGQLADKI